MLGIQAAAGRLVAHLQVALAVALAATRLRQLLLPPRLLLHRPMNLLRVLPVLVLPHQAAVQLLQVAAAQLLQVAAAQLLQVAAALLLLKRLPNPGDRAVPAQRA